MKPGTKLSIFILLISVLFTCFVVASSGKGKISTILSPFSKKSSIFSFFIKHEKPKKIIYGYLPYWSFEDIKYIKLDELTNIAYFGAYLSDDGNFEEYTTSEDGTQVKEPGYAIWKDSKDLTSLINKCNQEGVRFAFTVVAHKDEKIDKFLDCKDCWNTLLKNLISELNFRGIKDVNLNFEYGGETDPQRANEFSELTKYLNTELDKVFGDSFLVVSAFADSTYAPRISSDLDNLGRYADGIFIMGYDFHRPASDSVGPVSPILGNEHNLTTVLNDFLAKIPPNKIILGLPYYGYNWVVSDTSPDAKTIKDDEDSPLAESQTYDSVMNTILDTDPEIKWNDEAKSPYFSYVRPESGELRTVYFENEDSLKAKYELVKQKGLAGVGIWALGYDGGYSELWDVLYDEFIR